MFDYQGPIFAANALAEYREDFSAKLPEAQNQKLRELNREVSPVPKLVGGMEVLFVVAVEKPLSTQAARAATLATLGVVARAVAEGQFGGADNRDRAWAIVTWAAHELAPTGEAPARPDVDTAYSTIPPEPVVPTPAGPTPPPA